LNKRLFLFAALLLIAGCLFAEDLIVRPQGFVAIPLGSGNKTVDGYERYKLGGGAGVGLDFDFSSLWPNKFALGYVAGVEAGVLLAPISSGDQTISFYSFAVDAGAYYFPLSRLFTRADAALGIHQDTMGGGKNSPGFMWRVGGEAGFRLTPDLTFSGGLGWRQYHRNGRVSWSGLTLGVAVNITLEVGRKTNENITVTTVQNEPAFPVFAPLYRENPVATLVVANDESAELRDITVSFRAAGYTSSEMTCGALSLLPRGRTAEFPLYADFSAEILRFTENSRISGEVIIRYSMLGKKTETVRSASVRVYNREAFPTTDMMGLAAFVSSTSPEVLEFSKNIVGLARNGRRQGLNLNMQSAVWLYEALRAGGVAWRPDNLSSGEESGALMEVQFPAQTLAYRSGSATDIGLLYAAALESAGIRTAFIPLADNFIVCVNLGIGERAAETLFDGQDRILVIDDEVWLPVSAASLEAGFTRGWNDGVASLNALFEGEEEIDFFIMEEAWQTYPPSPFPALGVRIPQADVELTERNAAASIDKYIETDIEAVLYRVREQVMAEGTAAAYNRLGIVLVRAGRIGEAKAAYERAAGLGLVAAMTNRGNLALNERDYAGARRWFQRALENDPGNAAALSGMKAVDNEE
jgi:tetratricopeptide (TPR) repeat protein